LGLPSTKTRTISSCGPRTVMLRLSYDATPEMVRAFGGIA
jgi:hypothetical protein